MAVGLLAPWVARVVGAPAVPTGLAVLALGVTMNHGAVKGTTFPAYMAQGALGSTVLAAILNARTSALAHDGRIGPADMFNAQNPMGLL
jgi:hypothetical protein